MKCIKVYLLKINVDKELNVSVGLNGNSAEILAALDTVTHDILNCISAEAGVGYDRIAKVHCRNINKGIIEDATENASDVDSLIKKLLSSAEGILDSLKEE